MKNRASNQNLIEHADRVVRIDGGDEAVAGVLDRLEMARRHEAGDAGDREILAHHSCSFAGLA